MHHTMYRQFLLKFSIKCLSMSLLPTVTNYPRYLNLFQHRENLTALNSSNFLYFTPYKLHKSIIDYITILFLYTSPPLTLRASCVCDHRDGTGNPRVLSLHAVLNYIDDGGLSTEVYSAGKKVGLNLRRIFPKKGQKRSKALLQ